MTAASSSRPDGLSDKLTTSEHTVASTTPGTAIRGYIRLDASQIDAVNSVKAMEIDGHREIDEIVELLLESGREVDPRYLAMARTDYELAHMKLIRAITQPDGRL